MYSAEEAQKNIFHILHVDEQGQAMETGIARLEDGHDEWFWGEENIYEFDKQAIMERLSLATKEV